MRHRRALRTTMAGLAALASILAMVVVSAGTAQAAVICDQFGSTKVQNSKYVIQNNNWGDTTTQCITTTETGFSVTTASHNKPTNGAPGSYPSVYAGCHWSNCSTGSGLPMQASAAQFNSVRTSVSMTYPNSGTFDAAYDIWFDPTPRTDGQNTGAELMIWLNHTGAIQPVGSRQATVNLAGATWDVWFGNSGWNVVSYVRTSPTNSIDFSVNSFYSDAVNRGYAQRSWFMTSVQAGFEPWVGGVGLAVNNFTYSTSGGNGGGNGGGAGACAVSAAVQSQWSGGYVLNVTVTNTGGSATNGWTVPFTLPSGQQVTGGWGASLSTGGPAVTAQNLSYNGALGPNQSVTWGLQGSRAAGSTEVPTFSGCTTS
jgi:hypothetical protein